MSARPEPAEPTRPAGEGRAEPRLPDLDAVGVVRDLPRTVWDQVAEAFLAGAAALPRSELPPRARPYATWRLEALAAARPRAAIAAALVQDARLRAAVQEATAARGEVAPPAVVLVAEGRWAELLDLARRVSDERATRRRAAAERSERESAATEEGRRRRLEGELRAARAERDRVRGRLDEALERARAARSEADRQRAEAAALRGRLEALEQELEEERRRSARRLARQRRRLEAIEAEARVDAARARDVAGRLADLSAELHAALAGELPGAEQDGGRRSEERTGPPDGFPAAGLPREVPPAASGRPCVLPAGLTAASPAGVAALLRCPGVLLLVDGYNVAKHPRGVPLVAGPDQRRWLVRLVEPLVARYGCRAVVVFDGSEPVNAAAPASRTVRCVFSVADETADDRIVGVIEERDPEAPVVVATDDRGLAERCAALGADVVGVRPFLELAQG